MILADSTAVAAWQDRTKHKIAQAGNLSCTRDPKIIIRFQHARVRLVQCAWEGDWATFWSVWSNLADSTAVARQAQTPIFSKNGYPIINLFRPAHRAPAPLGDW
jgi:hypothetical protein